MVDCKQCQFQPGVYPELVEDALKVVFHGVLGQIEVFSDLLIGHRRYDGRHDLKLSMGQTVCFFLLPLRLYQSLQVLDHVQHSFAPYPELTIQNSVDRFHDQLTGCILEHQTTGTQLQYLYDLFLLDEQLQG